MILVASPIWYRTWICLDLEQLDLAIYKKWHQRNWGFAHDAKFLCQELFGPWRKLRVFPATDPIQKTGFSRKKPAVKGNTIKTSVLWSLLWWTDPCLPRYCARLQLALLQNVEDNLVREQAELDLALCLAHVRVRGHRSLQDAWKNMGFSIFWPSNTLLVNIQKTMENHHVQWVNPLFLWPFSIAM